MRNAENMMPKYVVASAPASERSAFIRRTYSHLAMAILAFVALEYVLLVPFRETTEVLIGKMLGTRYSWLIVLGLFMGVGWLADKWARSSTSMGMQYLGLALYVVAQAIIFAPLLYVAAYHTSPDIIPTAGVLTLGLFAGLTGTVFITKKDFSFMRGALMVGGFVAMGLIVCSILFGFELGTIFSVVMIGLAGGYILYYTSAVLRDYHPNQHVAAALALFSAVALMFFYILRLLMSLRRG